MTRSIIYKIHRKHIKSFPMDIYKPMTRSIILTVKPYNFCSRKHATISLKKKKKTHGEDRDALDHFQFVLQMFHRLVMITYFVSATDWINPKRTQVIVFEDSYSCNVTQSYRCYLAVNATQSQICSQLFGTK